MIRLDTQNLPLYGMNKRIYKYSIGEKDRSDLFGYSGFDLKQRYCTIIGNFYELLAKAIFGGEKFRHGTGLIPDLVINRGNNVVRAIEVKSCSWCNRIKLSLWQIERYGGSGYDVYYSIFKYGLDKILNLLKNKSEDECFQLLSQNTSFMIFIPLILIQEIIEYNEYGSKYITYYGNDSNKWEPVVRISSEALKRFLLTPGQIIRDMGIRSSHYRYIRRTLPKGVEIGGTYVKPFPILEIRDRKWKKPVLPF